MVTYQNCAQFVELIETSDFITGRFDFRRDDADLMDLHIESKTFQNCLLVGGDFASGTFLNCVFDKVIFLDSVFPGVSFIRCHFQQCKLVNVDYSCHFNDCNAEDLSLTREHPSLTQQYFDLNKDVQDFFKSKEAPANRKS